VLDVVVAWQGCERGERQRKQQNTTVTILRRRIYAKSIKEGRKEALPPGAAHRAEDAEQSRLINEIEPFIKKCRI
jgi:hypothetical protein